MIARRDDDKSAIKIFAALGLLAVAALLPYFVLLSNRAQTMDTVQLLAHSHKPDFTRSSIKLGLIVCALLAYAVRRRRIEWRDPRALLAASFALTPLIVFTQQVITGLSLQPLHYELFIAKDLALLALTLTIVLLWQRRERTFEKIPRRAFACFCLMESLRSSLAWWDALM